MSDVIMFENQQSWEDFATAIHEKHSINVLTTSSAANQIPKLDVTDEGYTVLDYTSIGVFDERVVLDIWLKPLEVSAVDGEIPAHTAESLDAAIRQAVVSYQHEASQHGCHLTGRFIHSSNDVSGALLRIYRNSDFVCTGHPEILIGTGLGTYHCDKCHELQVAGTFHSPKEMADV